MPEPLESALARVRALILDDRGLVRAVGAGRRRGHDHPPWRRVELRYVDLNRGRHLQLTTYDATQAHTSNLPVGRAGAAVDEALATPYGNWHVDTADATLQLRVTKRGEAQVHVRRRPALPGRTLAHDRTKPRLLAESDPFWRAVGIADDQGRVKPSRQDKHRQVEEFLRALDAGVDQLFGSPHAPPLADDRPLRVADLGSGNAYLTFATYAHLHGGRGLPIRLTGVDRSAPARLRNATLATRLGWADAVDFLAGSIETAELTPPDVVLALHACDTATDAALARAVTWSAPLVLAAPCCHHQLQAQLRSGPPPAPYRQLLRHGILAERLADVLTDTLRASVLRLLGYRVDVMEFVASRHTPRNTLLRAVLTTAPARPEQWAEYDQLLADWGLRPALAELLADRLAAARPA